MCSPCAVFGRREPGAARWGVVLGYMDFVYSAPWSPPPVWKVALPLISEFLLPSCCWNTGMRTRLAPCSPMPSTPASVKEVGEGVQACDSASIWSANPLT